MSLEPPIQDYSTISASRKIPQYGKGYHAASQCYTKQSVKGKQNLSNVKNQYNQSRYESPSLLGHFTSTLRLQFFTRVMFGGAYWYFATCPVVRSNWSSNYSWRACDEKLRCPVTAKEMEKNGNTNMWSVMNTVATTAITVNFAQLEIIWTAIFTAIIS